MIVIDASVAAKWYFLEPFTPEALALLDEQEGHIFCPDIFIVEMVGALVRRANMAKPMRQKSSESIARFTSLFDDKLLIRRLMDVPDIAHASTIALQIGHPLKDCIYLVLAMALACDLVTCDAKFATKAKDVWSGVRVLGG
jgi:predicted nucleic acid-binding protein